MIEFPFKTTMAYLSGLTQLKNAKCKSSELGTHLMCLGLTSSAVVRADQVGSGWE